MRSILLSSLLLSFALTGSGCIVVRTPGGMGFWASSPYEACVDCDPYHAPPPVAGYDRRSRRELRSWYRHLNAANRHGMPGSGCGCGGCFDMGCDGAVGGDWCDGGFGGFESCGAPVFGCDSTCAAPLPDAGGCGFSMYDCGMIGGEPYPDSGFPVGSYGFEGHGHGHFGGCPNCQGQGDPSPHMSAPTAPGPRPYVPPPVRPFGEMRPRPDESFDANGSASDGVPEVPGPQGGVPIPDTVPVPGSIPVPAPADPSGSALRQMHYLGR